MSENPHAAAISSQSIAKSILILRGSRIILDAALAALYGVTTKRFNEQVRRNKARFPPDFMFQLTREEQLALRSHSATSNSERPGRGGRRYPPYAFTEHGAITPAATSNSPTRGRVKLLHWTVADGG